ncbi:MAG: SDR family oxidoreductase, partial [Bacteroidota bacterium]
EFLGEPELAATYQEEALKSGVDNTIDSPDVEEVPVDVQTIPGIAALMEDTAEQSVTEEEVTEAVTETAAIAPMTEEAEVEAPAATVEEKVSTIEEEEQSIATALDVAATIDEAWRMVDAEQQGEALALLDEKLDTHPQDHDLHYNYAILLAQEGRTQDAQLQVDWLLQDGTDNEDVYFLAGELADIQEDGPRAREFYLKAVELEPEFGEAWYQLGQTAINYQTDDTERTVKYLKKALKYSNETNAAFQIGKLYAEELDQPKKAIKYFKKAIKIAPENGNAHYELARTYHRLRELDRARRAYQTAAIVQPELQTPESDLAFGLTTVAAGQTNEDQAQTLAALKENIKHLEDLLHQQSASEAPAGVSKKAGKTVFITGATAGIGKATAHKFASEGYRLIITGRRADRLTELQSEWQEAYGVDVHPLTFDVRDPEAVTAAIDGLPKDWQQIDILINNAGKAKGFDPIHEGQLSHWEEMIDTNLKGLLYLTRAVSPHMVERGSGHIINVASTAGKEVYPKGNVYCATKFAVDALTKGMRMDLHSHGVRVSQVAPAHVEETEFALVRFDGDAERAQIYEGFQPLRSPDVAETIFFIATQPLHVNILDVVLQGTQQPHSMIIDRSGRDKYQEEE